MPLTAFFVQLADFADHRGLAIAKPVAKRRQAFREPRAAFVEDQGGADLGHSEIASARAFALAGRKPEEQEAVGWQAGQGQRGDRGAGPGQGVDRVPPFRAARTSL